MTHAVFPVVEYQAYHVPPEIFGGYVISRGRLALDLTSVIAAREIAQTPGGLSAGVRVLLAASPDWIQIEADYMDFMRDWMRAKEIRR